MTNFEYTMHNGNIMHLTATDFAKLRDAIGNASASKNALKVDAFSNAEAFAYYKNVVYKKLHIYVMVLVQNKNQPLSYYKKGVNSSVTCSKYLNYS